MVENIVKTKSLLGRQACLSFLNDTPLTTADNSSFLEMSIVAGRGEKGPPGFNNNIYNKVSHEHTIETVGDPSSRNLPELEREKVAVIDRLQAEGKIKSTGRSPVKLRLFDKSANDHLYVNTITKKVPVAHDS